LKAINTDIPIRKYLVGRTLFLKEENFSFFKDTKNGPRIIKLLPLNARNDYRNDQEYQSKVAIKFRLIIFCHELSQIPPTVVII